MSAAGFPSGVGRMVQAAMRPALQPVRLLRSVVVAATVAEPVMAGAGNLSLSSMPGGHAGVAAGDGLLLPPSPAEYRITNTVARIGATVPGVTLASPLRTAVAAGAIVTLQLREALPGWAVIDQVSVEAAARTGLVAGDWKITLWLDDPEIVPTAQRDMLELPDGRTVLITAAVHDWLSQGYDVKAASHARAS